MANVYATKSGNWSDTTLWNTAALPDVIDDVYTNNFTVYVDGNYRVSSVRNLSATSITRGGSFILNSGVSLSANVIGGGVDSVFCVRFLSAAPAFANITGNVSTSGSLVNVRQSFALELSSTGTLTVYGSAIGGNNNNSGTGVSDGYIQVNAPGTLNIFGSVQGSLNGNVYYGINNKAAGTVNVVGNVFGRIVSIGGVTQYVINNASTGTINVTGNIFAGVENANIGINNATTGSVNVIGNVTGGTGALAVNAHGINSTGGFGTVTVTGTVSGGNSSSVYGISMVTGLVNIRGDIYGGPGGSAHGLVFNSSGTISPSAFIVGNVYNGTGSSSQGINSGGNLANFISLTGNVLNNPAGGTADAINTTTTPGSIVNVLGNVVASGGSARITHNSTGTLNIVGTVSGSPINLNDHRVVSNFGSGTVNITGTVINGRSVNGYCVVSGGGGAGTVNIYGDVYGGTVTNAVALYNDGGALMQVFGNIYARDGGGGVQNQANGTFIVYGDVYGSGANVSGIRNSITGTVIVTGSVFGGVGSNGVGAANNGNGLMLIGRNVVAGVGSVAYGANNAATGYMVIGGTVVGNEFGLGSSGIQSVPGVFGSQTGTTIVRSLCCGARGQWPTAGVIRIEPLNSSTVTLYTSALSAGPSTVLFTSLSTDIVPPVSSVRLGTVYNLNQSTGTCNVPSISSVLQGVSIDNSVGIAALQPQTIWNYSTLSATDVNSLGGRLANVATVQSVGQQLTALN